MKKIVALVLSLVMVLGLATTAFAATTSTGSVATTSITPVKAVLYDLAAAGESMTEVATPITSIDLTTTTGKVIEDVPYYVPNVYKINSTYFFEVAKADAEFALKNNGAWTYLVKGDAPATAVVMDKLVMPADDEIDCGDANDGTDPVPYYVSGDDVYGFKGADWAVYNGEFVKYSKTAPSFKAHEWDADSVIVKATDVKGVVVPVTVECSECEKTFPVVYKTAFDNTWVRFVNYDVADGQYNNGDRIASMTDYYIVLNAVAADAPAAEGDKVESAETFDAGIAMYVGMSVMAAAGSAVVLKKKD